MMKLDLKRIDCRACGCDNMWFKESEKARCLDCKSGDLWGNSYSFYIRFSLEDGLYLFVTLHGEDDNTSFPTEDRIYTLHFNGRRSSGIVEQEIKDMAEKVLMEDFVKSHSDVLKDITRLINKYIS